MPISSGVNENASGTALPTRSFSARLRRREHEHRKRGGDAEALRAASSLES